MAADFGVVQAQFPGSRRKYHVRCMSARLGDTVMRHGWSGPARVVAIGKDPAYMGPINSAQVHTRACNDRLRALLQPSLTHDEYININLAGDPITMHKPAKPDTLYINSSIEQHEAQIQELQALKKAAKAERKAARKAAAERQRVLDVVKATLERECERGSNPVAAACELHRLFSK